MLENPATLERRRVVSEVQNFATSAHISAILALEDLGLPRKEQIIGFHGTSMFALLHLAREGVILPSGSKNEAGFEGSLYFFPVDGSLFEGAPPPWDLCNRSEAFQGAQSYANRLAKQHRLMKELRWDISDGALRDAALMLTISEPCQEFETLAKQFRLEPTLVRRILSTAHKEKGVVIGLGRSLCNSFRPISTENDPAFCPDLRVYCPKGLPIFCIAGIEPVGDFEMMVFDQLKKA